MQAEGVGMQETYIGEDAVEDWGKCRITAEYVLTWFLTATRRDPLLTTLTKRRGRLVRGCKLAIGGCNSIYGGHFKSFRKWRAFSARNAVHC